MRRLSAITLAAFLFGLVTLAACTVSFEDDTTADGLFKCSPDAGECTGQDQSCELHESGDYHVCTSTPPCIDRDGDGYGGPENEVFTTCPKCESGAPGGCEVDCVDDPADLPEDAPDDITAADIHPGAVELCDGIDNDCSKKTGQNNPIGHQACKNDEDCPLGSAGVSTPSDTQWSCETIDGTPQCVLTGRFSNSESCPDDNSRYGICQEDGGWTKVPDECKTSG